MWYSHQQHCPQSQQQSWHGHINTRSTQHPQKTYLRTSYYCNTDDSSIANRTNSHIVPRTDKNELSANVNATRTDDVNVTGTDSYNNNVTGSCSDEMLSPSVPHQLTNAHWSPAIAISTKTSTTTSLPQKNPTSNSALPTKHCWDWLLYHPDIYSHLYTPSSSFSQQPQYQQDDELDLLARLPNWLLASLYPSMKQYRTADDENDSDQEISSLNNNHDEALLSMNIDNHTKQVSSNICLSSENVLNSQKLPQHRSTTPDTDDGYQSASDASRSDCSQQSSLKFDHHTSKDDMAISTTSSLMPKRISYAAAVKPIETMINNNNNNNKISPLSTPINKTKNNTSSLTINDMNNSGQKLKFVAPRFERMHHAKQYSSTSPIIKDSSPSPASLTNRGQTRSNNNNNNHHHHQRNHINNLTRRR